VPADADNSTHYKARKFFLDAANGITVLPPGGGADPVAEAAAYEAALRATERLAFNKAGLPVFDLMLLGAPCVARPASSALRARLLRLSGMRAQAWARTATLDRSIRAARRCTPQGPRLCCPCRRAAVRAPSRSRCPS
jgi:hypothetical protein